jgi:hypothetical protein
MKHLLCFLSLALLLLGTGCEKDKQDIAQKAIVGTWKIDKMVSFGVVTRDVGEITYTKTPSTLTTQYSTSKELYEAKSVINGVEDDFVYEFFQGSPEMILNHFDDNGRFTSVFVEMFTKDIFIYYQSFSGGQVKYYLSK